jgi:hypothetical protein
MRLAGDVGIDRDQIVVAVDLGGVPGIEQERHVGLGQESGLKSDAASDWGTFAMKRSARVVGS